MDQENVNEGLAGQQEIKTDSLLSELMSETPSGVVVPTPTSAVSLLAQAGASSCPTCKNSVRSENTMPSEANYIYAFGRVEMRFPSPGVEKEFAQAIARADTSGLTDAQATHKVLIDPSNRYIARRLCWVFTIEGLETYILMPRDPADFELLFEAVRPASGKMDLDIVVGVLGPTAPPEICNGLQVPFVVYDQLYSFDRDTLIKSIPRPKTISAKEDKQFRNTAEEVLSRIMQLADNAGALDEHRALNYLAARYPAVYEKAAQAHQENCSLTSVEVRSSRLSGTRRIVQVIFAYTDRRTDVTEKFFVRVDVTEQFPFLVTKLSPYFDID